jgi:MFS family permease
MEEEYTGGGPSSFWAAIKRGQTFRPLRNRNYRLLWIGQVGHSASLWVETVARSWLVWELTGSVTLLAAVNLLRAIPMLGFGLFAGAAADRFDKRKILLMCQTVTLLNKLVLAILIITGTVEVWHVMLTAFLMGCSMSFNQPARTALIPSLVSEGELTGAMALNSAAMNITRVIGPAGAGLLLAPLGIGGVYFVSSGIYIVALIATYILQVPPVIARRGRVSMWTDLGEAFRYIYSEKSILALILLALIPMVVAWPYMTLMPVFADVILGIGESGLGFLYSAVGIGALIAVTLIATLGKVPRKGLIIVLAIFCFGAFLAVFSQSTLVPLSLGVMALIGFVSTGSMVLISTTLLTTAPPELHGRVMGVYRLDRGLMPLGAMAAGVLADSIGAPMTALIMGGLCMLLALSMGVGYPLVRRIP